MPDAAGRPQPAPPPAAPPNLAACLHSLRQRQRDHHRRRRVRRAVSTLLTLALLAGGVAALLAAPTLYQVARAYDRVFVEPVPHAAPPAAPPPGQGEAGAVPAPAYAGRDRLTILLLGVDRREDEPARSDTMILVSIDLAEERAAMVSLPRDLRVVVPGYGAQKLNAAFALGEANAEPGGGPGLAVRTVEANLGLRVDHFVAIDFRGFVEVVDLVGGIVVDVPAAFRDDAYPTPDYGVTTVAFAAGLQRMDGERALQYARTRHADGDVRRAARQRQVLLALREQTDLGALLPRAPEVVAALGGSVRTDLDPALALDLARLAARLPAGAIAEHTLDPAVAAVQDATGDEYLIPDWPAVGAILGAALGVPVVPPPTYDPALVPPPLALPAMP
jgi:polyisoprenyl-teichoic acid--peptidoglycan teichoic acid transferase